MNYSSVRDLQWANERRNVVNCVVKFDRLKKELPFSASPTDPAEHGREIYYKCINGDFGPIADPAPKKQVSSQELRFAPDADRLIRAFPEIQKFLDQANLENATETPRAIILVWSTLLEMALGRLLEAFLIDHSDSRKLVWTDGTGPLTTFSGRVKICFSLGLISQQERSRCKIVQKLRDIAAHEWDLSLHNPKFMNRGIPNLKTLYNQDHSEMYEWVEDDLLFMLRSYYSSSCSELAFSILARTKELDAERRTIRT